MALTNNNLEMIKALASNDMNAAKRAAMASLVEDKTKKNEYITGYYKKLLAGNGSVLMSNLPKEMQTFLVGEAPGGFDTSRYYVRESDTAMINDVIKMKLISDEMALKRIPYKNTTLMYGPSGTGKTELGRYIAYKLNLPFFYVSFVSTIDSYMGNTAKNLHKIFEFCNSIPCVLMLDEIDCVATKRSSDGGKGADGEIERTTITLMQELDRLPNHVTLIAATNRLDLVDDALLRRFSVKHEVPNMSRSDLYAMTHQYLEATDTEKYVSEAFITDLLKNCDNPGQLMPELIKEIGRGIYEEKKDTLTVDAAAEADKPEVWEVSYIWKTNIAAESKEDAISIAQKQRQSYYAKATSEKYDAKRVDFIY